MGPSVICPDLRELCDGALFLKAADGAIKRGERCGRIYLGSSFCANYFLQTNVYETAIPYCAGRGIAISLSVPVFPESLLSRGKETLTRLLEAGRGVIDEVLVNDPGMLRFAEGLPGISVVLGRLFFKDPRDGRLSVFSDRTAAFGLLSDGFFARQTAAGVELDPIAATLDLSALSGYRGSVALNGPYCYMSAGMICKFASTRLPPERKFRPSSPCGMECLHMAEIHSDRYRPGERDLIRAGRAVYFYQPGAVTVGREPDRRLFFHLEAFIRYLER